MGDSMISPPDLGSQGEIIPQPPLRNRQLNDPEDGEGGVADTLFNRASGLAEVVIPPRSGMIGQTVFPGMVTPSGDLIILAVQRRGEDQGPNETVLSAGDTLLL